MNESKIDIAKKKILSLKQSNLGVSETVQSLHNIAKDIPVVIVTCGPSLKKIPREKLIALKSKCILIAVKQAHSYLKGNELIHLINQYNLSKYYYSSNNYVIAGFNYQKTSKPILSRVDLNLPYDPELFNLARAERLSKRLAVSLNFDQYLLSNTIERPWGPGVILELAIYIAIHLGSKDIFLVGYDLADPSQDLKSFNHFYDSKSQEKKVNLSNRFAKITSNISGISETRIRYELGLRYNKVESLPSDENRLLVESSKDLYLWLKDLGIALNVCSDNSYVSEIVPRIKIDELSNFFNKK